MKSLRVIPSDEWASLRVLVVLAGSLAIMLAVAGVFESTLFAKATTLKYLVTVAGAASVVMLATFKAPLRALVGLAIFLAPFDFVMNVGGIQATPLLAVDLLALLVALPRQGGGTAALRPMTAAFVLLLIPAIVTSSGAGHWLAWIAVTIATGWLTFIVAREPRGPAFVAAMLTVTALVQGAIAIWEFKTKQQLNLYGASIGTASAGNYFFNYGQLTRASGTLPDPIGLGQVLALCLPMMVAFAASMRRWRAAIVVLCVAAVAGLGLVLSLSRMSIIGGVAGVLVALPLLPGSARLRTLAGVSGVVALVVVLGLSFGGGELRTRISSIFRPTAAHVSTAQGDLSRIRIWNAAIRTAGHNLETGVGVGNITSYLPRYGIPVNAAAQAQDTYLQVFAEGGLLGLLALLGLIAASFRDLFRAFARRRIWVAGAAGALIATLIAWTTDVEVRYVQVSAMVAILMGLIAALSVQATSEAEASVTGRS
jgi:O-antigen ligase